MFEHLSTVLELLLDRLQGEARARGYSITQKYTTNGYSLKDSSKEALEHYAE